MRAADKLLLLAAALACASCGGHSQQIANNDVAANGIDVETLPPDESDTTPTNELENGVDEPADSTPDLNSD